MSFGDRFLVQPDRLPTAATSRPWGECSIALDVAGPVCFSGLSTRQLAAAEARYGAGVACVASSGASSIPVVYCRRLEREAFVLFDRTGWDYTIDLDPTLDTVAIAGYGFAGLIRLAPSLAGTLWTCEDDSSEFPAVIENFYRVFTAYQALDLGGVLLHSAAILEDGQASVFFGHSGAGKSTLAGNALKAGHAILSDDLNLVLGGGSPTVRRVPFAGTYGRAPAGRETYPLRAIIRLKQGENGRHRLSGAKAFGTLIAAAPFINRDPHRYERLAAIAEALVQQFAPWQAEAAREGFDRRLLDPPGQ